jgi:hypothetical protein
MCVLPGGSATPNSVVGVLGMDVLSQANIEIDLPGHRVNIFPRRHCDGRAAYWASSWFEMPFDLHGMDIENHVTLDGKPMRAWISTGLGQSVIQAGVAEHTFDVDKFPHSFQALAIGPFTLHNIPMDKIEYPSFQSTNIGSLIRHTERTEYPDITIGMDVLQLLHTYISYADSKIYLTLLNDPGASGAAKSGQ